MSNGKEPIEKTIRGVTFHWSYIILPLVILLLSIIIVAYFYHRLPAELDYYFKSDGSPDRWAGRGTVILWMLLPQLVLTLMTGVTTWGITKLVAHFIESELTFVKPERILLLIGNMVALPQIILCFAMLDIFSYNAYQIHILPLWVFSLIIVGLGSIILSVSFIRVISQTRRANR